jgi:hypothetical protein
MNHPGTFNPNLCLYAKMQEWVQLQARTGHKGAAGTCPVGSLKNLTLVLWEIFNRATKLGRPRAMILLGGPQRTSSDLTAPLPPSHLSRKCIRTQYIAAAKVIAGAQKL